MTRQFHARVRRVPRVVSPRPRERGPHTLSFTCFRLIALAEADREPGGPAHETVELCDPRNAMRLLVVPAKPTR